MLALSFRSFRSGLFVPILCLAVVGMFAQGTKPNLNPYDDPEREREAQLVKKRAEWFLKGRTVNGKPAADRVFKAHQQRKAMERLRATTSAASPSGTAPSLSAFASTAWTNVGPTPINADALQDFGANSGRITTVAVDQNDPTGGTVLVGGAYGGVWKTTNSGTSWTSLTDSQPTLSTGAITIQPSNSQVILVGTGEPNNALDSYYGLGILRSTDGGSTWTLISSAIGGGFAGQGFSRFAWGTVSSDFVVAAVANTPLGCDIGPGCGNQGIYYSTNAGVNWTLATVTDSGGAWGSVTDVVWNASASKFFAAMKNRGYYSSSDGITWARLATQPVTITSGGCPASATGILVGRLTVKPGANEVYAWTVGCDGVTDRSIARSTDGGSTWAALSLSGISSGGQGFYDLYVAAVPNGSNTDLYAAGVDLFKCSSANSTTCAWSNLTDVYGANPVHVHPDEHGFDFLLSNPNIAYIGNDGGAYKITNSLTTPTFTNLNASIGSLTQFISISQHPTNAAVILGGTQDNGSPATNTALSATAWNAVNAGDGGYNAIDRNSPDSVWYSTNTDLSIQRSTVGFGSNAADFGCDLYGPSASTQTGGFCPMNVPDDGSFYTPYILDPANNSKIIIGTCRVWRGNALASSGGWGGTNFANALSQNFGTGSTGAVACTGADQMVRSLGAGGSNSSGSAVLYAGMDQNLGTIDGHVFVKTAATTGATSWTDTTSHGPGSTSINPGGFPVSDIFVDRAADATGNTAYATIMGFTGGGKHVWKTTNAGGSWTDISAGLPDAPADAIVGDPGDPTHQTLYVGTDVGVFVTPDGGASWSVFGTGLPNVPVLTLRVINNGAGNQFLRAGTHGRGAFSIPLASIIPPDYSISFSGSPLSVVTGSTRNLTGTITPVGGYTGSITISCNAVAPATCSAGPNPVVVTAGAVNFNLTVGDSTPGNFSFTVHGTDGVLAHDSAAQTVSIGSFTLTPAPTPASNTVTTGNSAMYTVSITGNNWGSAVVLSCSGLPNLSSCGFSPNNQAPNSATVTSTLTISTTKATAAQPVITPTAQNKGGSQGGSFGALALALVPLFGAVLIGFRKPVRGNKRSHVILWLGLVLLLVLMMPACGGGGGGGSNNGGVTHSPGTTPGTYTVTINGNSGGTTQTTTVQLVVQ
jgi:large repetitive protein